MAKNAQVLVDLPVPITSHDPLTEAYRNLVLTAQALVTATLGRREGVSREFLSVLAASSFRSPPL